MLSWKIRKIKGRHSVGPPGLSMTAVLNLYHAHKCPGGILLKCRFPGTAPRDGDPVGVVLERVGNLHMEKYLEMNLGQGVPPGKTWRNTREE